VAVSVNLIVGAGGRLGGGVARRLLAASLPVRAMSRDPGRLAPLAALGAEVVRGDLTDPASVARACRGAHTVLAAAHAFVGVGANAMARVDDAGNRRLIDSAREAGVRHFVFTSARYGADDAVDFFRVKFAMERYLEASGLPFTILLPAAFMEEHAERIGRPVIERGTTVILGRGESPVRYVAVDDVAHVAAEVMRGAPLGAIVPLAGPEALTARDVVAVYERVAGRAARVRYVSPRTLRLLRATVGSISSVARRILDAALLTEANPPMPDTSETERRFPMRATRLEELVRRRFEAGEYRTR
jgi:uncharacterized protein YbjT (DUF2867 family)